MRHSAPLLLQGRISATPEIRAALFLAISKTGMCLLTSSFLLMFCYFGSQLAKTVKKKVYSNEETTVFVCSCVAIVLVSTSLLISQWLIPYICVSLWPVLISIRIVAYWPQVPECKKGSDWFKMWMEAKGYIYKRRKMILLLLDFCYFINILQLVFLSMPTPPYLFTVIFVCANGPIIWATQLFVDSIMLHRIHRMSSSYFHLFPALLSFCIRWYPDRVSQYWFKELKLEVPQFSLVWLWSIPLIIFLIYYTLYYVIVIHLIKPSADYMTIISCFEEGEKSQRMHKKYGKGSLLRSMCIFNICYGGTTMFASAISFYVFKIHCFLIILVLLMTTINTIGFYRRKKLQLATTNS